MIYAHNPTFLYTQAFLHIILHESDRDYTQFFWLSDPTDPNSELVSRWSFLEP